MSKPVPMEWMDDDTRQARRGTVIENFFGVLGPDPEKDDVVKESTGSA